MVGSTAQPQAAPALFRARWLTLLTMLVLAGIVVLTALFAYRSVGASLAAQDTLAASSRVSQLLSTLQDAETGQRGYLLTGRDEYLQPYEAARARLGPELDQVAADPGLDPEMQASVGTLRRLAAAKMAELAETVRLRQAGDPAAALALVQTNAGKATMDEIRATVAEVERQLSQRLQARQAAADRDAWLLRTGTSVAALLTLILTVLATTYGRQHARELAAARNALQAANDGLERTVKERTRDLRDSEAGFRTLSEAMPSLVFVTDAAGANIYTNPQFQAYAGLSAAQLMGSGWMAVLHPDDADRTRASWQHSVETVTSYEVEYRFRRHDGQYRWFLGRGMPLTGEDGAVSRWVGTCTDIDDQKRAEAALATANTSLEVRVAERSRELDRIFRLSTDMLAVADFEGRFRSMSPAWERITGRPLGEALTRNFRAFLHPDDLPAAEAAHARLQSGEPAVGFEVRYQRADGSWCWLAWSAVSLVEEGLIYAVARDVTGERDRDEQLRQSQKMEVVGQLTGGIAHDFNNLLTVITGSLELLQRQLREAEPRLLRRVDTAMEGARRAAALTHRLLAFSRRQALEPHPVEPNRLVSGMSDLLNRVLGENIALEVVSAAGLWRVMADANQLENAVLNLAVNARDAMPGGGRLTIETENAYLDDDYAARQAEVTPGQYAMIAVADTGHGMTAEVRAKVFEPFFTTKPQGQGTGLGLAQVYGFIKQSGGHVTIYSETGQGTTVKLYLPRYRGQETATLTQTQMPPDEDLLGHGETVLVVEDEAGVRAFTVEVLEELGYRVLAAEDAAGALALVAAEPDVALLFTDVVLTGTVNGRQLADEVARRRPGLPVLFTTGYTRNAIIHHGRLDDGVNFIGKPFTATGLARKVRSVLDAAAATGSIGTVPAPG